MTIGRRQSLHQRLLSETTPSPSAEHYLRAILELSGEDAADDGSLTGARVTDLAASLGVSKATVTITAGHLIEKGYLERAKDRRLKLTSEGRRHALRVVERHALLHEFIENVLCLPRADIEKNICRIEHALSDEIFERIEKLVIFYRSSDKRHSSHARAFRAFLDKK
ncbi:MAG: metal-dependent transcriptional regulator [Planctomycetota bacterium]